MKAIFAAAALGVTLSAIVANPRHAAYGAGLVLTGLPLFALFVVRQKRSSSPSSDAAPPIAVAPDGSANGTSSIP